MVTRFCVLVSCICWVFLTFDVPFDDSKFLRCIHLDMWSLTSVFWLVACVFSFCIIFDLCCTDVTSDDSKLLRCIHLDMWVTKFCVLVSCLVFCIIFDLCCTDVTSDDSCATLYRINDYFICSIFNSHEALYLLIAYWQCLGGVHRFL